VASHVGVGKKGRRNGEGDVGGSGSASASAWGKRRNERGARERRWTTREAGNTRQRPGRGVRGRRGSV
jgi:hypothetical protein